MVQSTSKLGRLAATCFSLLLSAFLLQKIPPVQSIPSCPRSCSCPGVKEVHCTFRHLTVIPKTFPKDTERLNLGYNSLTEVEGSGFSSLGQLEMLMLHGNDISAIHPGAFYSLRSLQILKLSYNKLTSVNPGMLEGLVGLVRLHLDHNLIDFIEPYSFNGLTSLKLLQLEGNLLKEIHPHTFITVSALGNFWTSGLKHLHLADNLLEQLPASVFKTAQRLELLTLHGNPWTCDCQLHWVLEWNEAHQGVTKCKRERGVNETCPQCYSPQHLNGTQWLRLTPAKLPCERPLLHSPLKQWDNPMWAEPETEPDLPYVQDFEKPLGQLTVVLSDSHGNSAHVACDVRHPGDSSPMTWATNPHSPGELSVNVSLATILECEIDREKLQSLWQLVAYYYESPAILERGQQRGDKSGVTFQYVQVVNENSPYFTELKGYLVAEPGWLLQSRVTLKLNRQQTTTKKLVLDFTTLISQEVNSHKGEEDDSEFASSWALLRRGTTGRIQTAPEGSKVNLECDVITTDPRVKVEWILPDLTIAEESTEKTDVSKRGKLVIFNATTSDSGVYHCVIRTKAGVDMMPLRLTIKELALSPTAYNGQKVVANRGGSITLPCGVSSVPPSQTVWYLPKNQVLLPEQKTRNTEVLINGTLVVKKLTRDNAGEYSCLTSNLYGVDMLSHIVEIPNIGASDKSTADSEREQKILTLDQEEEESSGGDFQEITRAFATEVPEKVGDAGHKPDEVVKKTKIKTLKRKPNKSVKDLDPNRWAEMLAKAHAKPSAATAGQWQKEQTTVPTKRSFSRLASTIKLDNYPQRFTTSSTTESTKFPLYTIVESEPQDAMKHDQTAPENPVTHSGTTEETSYQVPVNGIMEKVEVTTTSPFSRTIHQETKPDYRRPFVPIRSNNRRPPYRRGRPPNRRIHPQINPFQHPFRKFKTTAVTTTTPMTTTTTTTPATTTLATTTTTTTTTTAIPTTSEHSMPFSAEYHTEDSEDKEYDDYVYKDYVIFDEDEGQTSETPPNNLHNGFISSTPAALVTDPVTALNSPQLKPVAAPSIDDFHMKGEELTNLEKTGVKNTGVNENLHLIDRKDKHLDKDSRKNMERERHKPIPATVEKNEEKSKTKMNTQSRNTQINSHNRSNKPLPNQNTFIQTMTSLTEMSPENTKGLEETHREKDKEVEKSNLTPKIQSPPNMNPVHPWLHHTNTGEAQPTNSKKKEEINQSHNSRYDPIVRWPSHHHPHHSNPHSSYWPGQSSFPHTKQGIGSRHPVTQKPWSFRHPWVHSFIVTNRPEIIAETIKPTPTASVMENHRIIPDNYHHQSNGRSKTEDYLFMSRLRNRYRQAQLERIMQQGRTATPRPKSSHYNLQPPITQRPFTPPLHGHHPPKPPSPTAPSSYSPQLRNPGKPSSAVANAFLPTSAPHNPATLHAGYERRQFNSRQATAAPPFPWLLTAGGGGVKPHITTVADPSISVLAENDVYLPCKAAGVPGPNIAWTKVSTGATLSTNTKHGPRFEVFKNGTFLIKNIHLQDRGQYLCTAKNKFGSDRMVVNIAVQTEAPKIQPPESTEVTVYMGKHVTLPCLASGKPAAQVSWILPDRTVVREVGKAHSAFSGISILSNGTLEISSANHSIRGQFKCIASNVAGADTITYRLHVAALPPSISEKATDNILIRPGKSVYVHCSVKGEPVPTVKWVLPDGLHIKPSQFLGSRLFVFPNGTLFVKNVFPSDGGRYECLASNAMGVAKRTVQLEVEADSTIFDHQAPPSVLFPTSHHYVSPSRQHVVSAMYGSTVYLHCQESTQSSRGTVWQLPSKTIVDHTYSPERSVKVFHNGTLRILQLTEVDSGNYLCIFQRPNGEEMELFQIDVLMTPPKIEQVRTAQTEVTSGENFQVDCVVTGLPDPEVSWSLPDGTLINNALQSDDSGPRSRRYIMFENGTLLLQHIVKTDEGDYTCHAKNKLGQDERKVSVKVGPKPPQIGLKSQSLLKVKFGESVKLSCQATGEPTPKIIWISPQKNVIPASTEKFQIMGDGMLVVKKLTLEDEGKYACVAQNSVGVDVKYILVEVEIQEPLINGLKGKGTTTLLGISYQTAIMDCRVEGKPQPKIWWITPIGLSLSTPYLGGRFQVHQNGSLELRGVRKTDEGRYICVAKSDLGEASLTVDLKVASLAEKPSFATPNIEILPIKDEGGEILLECPARGKPNPNLSWLLPNGTMLPPGLRLQRFIHHLSNGTLRVSNLNANDKGVYRCLARNVAGQAEKRYALEAGRRPVIRGFTGGMKITFGLNLNLPCSADGWPQASITWTLPNGVVLNKPQTIGRISFFNNGTLQIKQVATFDKGTYICKASNLHGSSTLSYPVTVMVFPPRITTSMAPITRITQGTEVTLQCTANGMPKPDISWTLPGRTTLIPHNRYAIRGGIYMTQEGNLIIQNPVLTNSGIYKCNAKNGLGTDFKSTYLQVV